MTWTWDRYRDWQRARRKEREDADPLARFIKSVDVMFYVAAVAFVITIAALLVG
jgi:hypothetical protein